MVSRCVVGDNDRVSNADLISPEAEAKKVNDALADLLRDHDPTALPYSEFRSHQYDYGLAWVHFPEGRGGLGVRPQLQKEVETALRAAGAPAAEPAQFFMHLAGPTILTHGSEAVQDRFLKPMFTGEERWCQLFSEPGAGSDFAGLGARAVRDGDEWIVNGQKVWNTLAHLADFGMLVTRSDPDAPKHKGMTYFALDMKAAGVEVRPLRQITGEAEFNEVYLTDVRIPDSHRIGEVGEGWRASLTTLMNERATIGAGGTPKRGSGIISSLVDTWNEADESRRTPAARHKLMELWIRAEVLRLTNIRGSQNRRAGNPGPEGSVAKLAIATLNQDVMNAAVSLEGAAGMIDYDYTFRRPDSLSVSGVGEGIHHSFLRVRANSIEGRNGGCLHRHRKR